MDYDFRNRAASSPYDAHISTSRTTSSSAVSMRGQSLYPRIGQQDHTPEPTVIRHSFYHQTSAHAPSSSGLGLGIRIATKPEYRMSPPPHLVPQLGDIPRSNFQFDFELERKILAEVEKGSQNWSRLGLENLPSKTAEWTPSPGSTVDPVVSKYIAAGLNREVVPLAVANYGDNRTKVEEFANGYTLLKEMGFSPNNIAESLLMFDNDTDKALAHCLNGSS